MDYPEWWPKNPYFESAMATITNDIDYANAVPNTELRTAISWYLGNRFWRLASEMILEAMQEQHNNKIVAELLPSEQLELVAPEDDNNNQSPKASPQSPQLGC